MADEPLINEEFSDAHNAEISDMSDEIAELNQKINDLEQENSGIARENKEFKNRVEELTASIEKLSSENVDLKNQVEKAYSEIKAMEAVAARASELQGEVARLHQDLASATSDLQEAKGELSGLKTELEGVKGRDKEKEVMLEAAEMEKALLGAELDAKDIMIQDLTKNVKDLMINGKSSETESKVEKIRLLQNSLDALINGGKKGVMHNDWLIVGSTSIGAVAVLGLICYVRAARKH